MAIVCVLLLRRNLQIALLVAVGSVGFDQGIAVGVDQFRRGERLRTCRRNDRAAAGLAAGTDNIIGDVLGGIGESGRTLSS